MSKPDFTAMNANAALRQAELIKWDDCYGYIGHRVFTNTSLKQKTAWAVF